MVIIMKHTIAAGEFKAKCLQLMDEVYAHHYSLTITKHNKPIAQLIPFKEKTPPTKSLFGSMKDTVTIIDDIISPSEETWFAADD